MEKLREHNLYGKGLIEIKGKLLLDKYNGALNSIGIEHTALKSFHVDGWGWSPEIALEKEDNFYLSHGLANPYAIIISPRQKDVPVYMPYHSFDNQMKDGVFNVYASQIHDLTTRTAIIMECDQEISSYRSPQDLLGIEYFTLKFSTVDNLSEAKQFQMKLEKKFYDEEDAWADSDLRNLLRTSYQKYGVLASKKFLLPDHKFMNVDSFYTKALKGIYLFRDLPFLKQPLLIREHKDVNGAGITGQASNHLQFHIKDGELKDLLIRKNIIGIYPSKLFEQVEDMERMRLIMVINLLNEKEPELDIATLNSGQLKKRINQYAGSGELGDLFFELESVISATKKGKMIEHKKLSKELYNLLLSPNPELNYNLSWLMWRILLQLNPLDIFRLYVYDKKEFFKQYETWSTIKKNWAIDYIKTRYISSKELNKTR